MAGVKIRTENDCFVHLDKMVESDICFTLVIRFPKYLNAHSLCRAQGQSGRLSVELNYEKLVSECTHLSMSYLYEHTSKTRCVPLKLDVIFPFSCNLELQQTRLMVGELIPQLICLPNGNGKSIYFTFFAVENA